MDPSNESLKVCCFPKTPGSRPLGNFFGFRAVSSNYQINSQINNALISGLANSII